MQLGDSGNRVKTCARNLLEMGKTLWISLPELLGSYFLWVWTILGSTKLVFPEFH